MRPLRKNIFSISVIFFCCILSALFFACTTTPKMGRDVEPARLVDGVFEGSAKGGPNSAAVRVTIADQKIVKIEILQHSAWKGKKAEPVIPQRIIDKQSANVDAMTGATNSSYVIMNAVQEAVEKAYAVGNK